MSCRESILSSAVNALRRSVAVHRITCLDDRFPVCPLRHPLAYFQECSGTDMTGRPGDRTMEMLGGRKYRGVPRAHPLRPCGFAYYNRSGSKGAFRLPGAMWDHFRCTVEPSPVIFGVEECSFLDAMPHRISSIAETFGVAISIPKHEAHLWVGVLLHWGGTNRGFGKPCFCPHPKKRAVWTKTAKMTNLQSTH